MTAPGSGPATSGGECSAATPCFVCKLRALIKAQSVNPSFDDRPFAVNMVGIRLALSVTDTFDDQMVFFFSLPAAESGQALKDAKIEDDLIADIAAAAKAMNAAAPHLPGRGVRRVPCSAVELEPGKPGAGHRVVAMFPITTDAGLVRPEGEGDNLKKSIADKQQEITDRQALIAKLEDAKKTYEEKLLPDFKAKGKALNDTPPPKKGEAKSKARSDAEEALAKARDAIPALAATFGHKGVTSPTFDQWISAAKKTLESVQTTKANLDARLAAWSKTELDKEERKAFMGYRYAFHTKDGWEGESHALFPLGHHPDRFRFFLHHWSMESGFPALTVGDFPGERVFSGKGLDREFEQTEAKPRAVRQAPVLKANAAGSKAQKQAFAKETAALTAHRAKAPAGADADARAAIKAQNDDAAAKLHADQEARQSALEAAHAGALDDATREYVVLNEVRRTKSPSPPPAGAWIVRGCQVAGSPLADDDGFSIHGDPRQRRTGREVRLHYYDLTATLKTPDGLKIDTHYPAGGRPELPAGSTIAAAKLMFESGGQLTPVADDDELAVEAIIGGTNVHRGHNLKVKNGAVVDPKKTTLDYVHAWSTGCQVFPFFDDYNLFILLCGLSKRWRCLHGAKPPACARIDTGTANAPDAFVWAHASIDTSLPTGALSKQIKADAASLQKERKSAQATVKEKTDAWFKAQKKHRPPADADAEQQVAAGYDQGLADLQAQLDAAKAAAAAQDAAGGPKTDAAKAARAKADAASKEQDGQRQALAQEKKDYTDALAARDAVDFRIKSLDGINTQLVMADAATFSEKADTIDGIGKALGDAAPKLDAAPEAQRAAVEGKKVTDALPDELKQQAFERGVKMKHDWMRTCDLAQTCPGKYSYTLIELTASDPTGKIQNLHDLGEDFAKKAGGADAYPKWFGFGAK